MEGSSTSPEWLRDFRVNTNTCVAIAGGAVAVAPAAAAGLLFFFLRWHDMRSSWSSSVNKTRSRGKRRRLNNKLLQRYDKL
jgi:hypothetical protein